MKTSSAFSLVWILGHLCAAQTQTSPGAEPDVGEQGPLPLQDIWDELRELRDTVVEQKVELRYLTERVTAAESVVEALEMANAVGKVAFSASLLESGEGNTGSDVFVSSFGYFTAAVRALYYFSFTGHVAHTESGTLMRLVKNEDFIVASGDRRTTAEDPEDNVANGVVLQLEVGDVVSVQLSGEIWDDQYHRTTFNGFLLFPL
uniref:C1q domain-containing protein n=1 Tax=Gasterosteus aculeatus aculeatus TaxID=481459 RepID=A0AAQ4PXM3_GASAC